MILNRRTFLCGLAALSAADRLPAMTSAPLRDFTREVDPFIGTGGFGHCFPAATVPFGAVQLGPDTGDHEWLHCSGYHYDDTRILGFSHTHLSGTGVGDMQDFRFMPGPSAKHMGEPSAASFAAAYTHADEHAEPGYYRVQLAESHIVAEFTATERTGLHRYTFPEADGCLLLDLTNVWRLAKATEGEECLVRWARLHIQGKTITAARSTNAWAAGREIFLHAELSMEPARVAILADGNLVADPSQAVAAQRVVAVLHFQHPAGTTLLVRAGISGVDVEGARRNLEAELPRWDFERTRAAAKARWNQELARVNITAGGTGDQRKTFYTGLYHAMLAPTLFDDLDGRYRGMDGSNHVLPAGRHNYSTFSLWDTYRALHPLFTLILEERVSDLVSCIIRQSTESAAGVTVWPLQGKETGCMDGYHSAPVVAEAIAKGYMGLNVQAAWKAFGKRALHDDYRGLADYRKYGYLPCDLADESCSKTCDYSYDDWCVATIATAAGAHEDAAMLRKRSHSYRALFDAETAFIRPKYADGHWAGPFDPRAITDTHKWRDYTEANAWQTTFLVQHDPEGLMEMLGGPAGLEKKLDELFSADSKLPTEMMPPDVTGLVGQYCQGNEPSHHIAYYYNTAGAPHKTQHRVHQLMTELYHARPDAMAGNEDCGQMSAWLCMNSFGFYPMDPTSATYDVGTPLFDEIVLTVGKGRMLKISADRESPASIYVCEVRLNGRRVEHWKLRHSELTAGGHLIFKLADRPLR